MGWGEHTYSLLDRLREIEIATNAQLWQSALSLALTIPDICGQIEFGNCIAKKKSGQPILCKDGKPKRQVGEQYKSWFRNYIEPYYENDITTNDKKINTAYFNAEMCWQLRNAFLHSGSDDIKNDIDFYLHLSSSDMISSDDNGNIIRVSINIRNLCLRLCEEGKLFCERWDNKSDFIDRSCRWIDINEFSKIYETANQKGGEE